MLHAGSPEDLPDDQEVLHSRQFMLRDLCGNVPDDQEEVCAVTGKPAAANFVARAPRIGVGLKLFFHSGTRNVFRCWDFVSIKSV